MRSLSPPKNRFLRGIYLMGRRYLHHSVAIQGAALAFYLLFTIFPLLIFVSALLGLLDLDVAAIIDCCSLACSSPSTFPCGPPAP